MSHRYLMFLNGFILILFTGCWSHHHGMMTAHKAATGTRPVRI